MKTLKDIVKLSNRSRQVIYKRLKKLGIECSYQHNSKGAATRIFSDADCERIINCEAINGRPKKIINEQRR